MAVSEDIRRQLISRARTRRTRTTVFSAARPTHWAPFEIAHPQTGETFTPDGAWEFVADLLVNGIEVTTIVLDKPPGWTGYVIKAEGWKGAKIYIKLQLGSDMVIGRSFHLSIE